MHFSVLLLGASLASAQYTQHFGPSQEQLDYMKHINGGSNNIQDQGQDQDQNQHQNEGQNQGQNQNQNYNQNGNYNYHSNYGNNGNYGGENYSEDYDNDENAVPSTDAPVHAQASSPAPVIHSTFVVRPSPAPIASPQAQDPIPGFAYNYPTPTASEQPLAEPSVPAMFNESVPFAAPAQESQPPHQAPVSQASHQDPPAQAPPPKPPVHQAPASQGPAPQPHQKPAAQAPSAKPPVHEAPASQGPAPQPHQKPAAQAPPANPPIHEAPAPEAPAPQTSSHTQPTKPTPTHAHAVSNPAPHSHGNQAPSTDESKGWEQAPPSSPKPAPAQDDNQPPSADSIPHDVPAGTSGDVAPIDPLEPGSQVAPVMDNKPQYGEDQGNTFCVGQCYADKSQMHCSKPYALPVYKSAKGCYMCCFTSDF